VRVANELVALVCGDCFVAAAVRVKACFPHLSVVEVDAHNVEIKR